MTAPSVSANESPSSESTLTIHTTAAEAMTAARDAQAEWGAVSPAERARRLNRLSECIADRTDQIAGLIHEENGKPLTEAVAHEVVGSIQLVNHHCSRAPQLLGDHRIRLPMSPHRNPKISRRPFGVLLAIAPWNLPWIIPMSQVLPGLLAGNAVILKPSELTPRTALLMQHLFAEIDLPAGLLQVLTGDGALGAELISSGPDKVLFTGSMATGRAVMRACAEFPIPVALELGGVDAMVVRADADLEFATSAIAWGGTFNGGQACCSVERLLVHESIASALRARLLDKLSRIDPYQDLAPAIDDRQLSIWRAHLSDAQERGLTCGPNPEMLTGRLMSPRLISGTEVPSSDVWKHETFGPLIAMTTFQDDAEAVRLHNESPFGLTASIVSSDTAAAEDMAADLHAGSVSINDVAATMYGSPELPWGGVGASGFGKTHGEEGLLEASWAQVIERPRGLAFGPKRPWWYPYDQDQAAGLAALGKALAPPQWRGRVAGLTKTLPALMKPLSRRPRL